LSVVVPLMAISGVFWTATLISLISTI
jgi:hypothetical protein